MAGFIRQLLQSDVRADKTALRLFDQALRRAQRRCPIQEGDQWHALVDADAIAAELEWLLRGELYRVNLLNHNHYQAVIAAIYDWEPHYGGNESVARQRCGFIQNGLLGLLPQLKRQQQLQQLCQEYQQHLALMAAQHLTFQDHRTITPRSSEIYLSRITQKQQAVTEMQQTLQTRQDIGTQCRSFQQVFQANRRIIEQDRDSAAITFVKVVTTVLSLGLATFFGIWSVKGRKAAQHIETVLQTPATPRISA